MRNQTKTERKKKKKNIDIGNWKLEIGSESEGKEWVEREVEEGKK